jgi:oligosaccharide reducing-end xylanase
MYPNLFAALGRSQEAIDQKGEDAFQTMFFDPKERIYFEMGADMGYMLDTGNNDARTEGMSYGMMMAVQMDRKDIFDRLWLFSKNFMHHKDGKYEGYFAWSVSTEGVRNAQGPAPDGEEYYALALFFAANRWGEGEAPFNYAAQARDILRHCVHQHELVKDGDPMWDPKNHLIKFVPESPFSDPSYHLPHFYELFACGRMNRTGPSGARRRMRAVHTCSRRSTRKPAWLQSMRNLTGRPSGCSMTGSTTRTRTAWP